jgi:4-amino-4-deoxy-L-arabinose transferase-like glycosyltransferase
VNRFQALLLVCVVWAAIYLPGLGSAELKGEEGRRILPAITMLETGKYLVPYVGGKPFLRKPPLINWVIAGVFKVTGVRNEWTARLPSVLSVLALAITIVALSGRPGWLTVQASVVAALLFLTQVATVEKGRLAEIEALYFSLTGIAIVCWMAWWAQGRSPWLWWIVPHLVLGVSLLAKGPLPNLLFYYAIVVAVLWRAGELRRLWHPAHFIGLALMAGIMAAWAIPYKNDPGVAQLAANVWREQSLGRLRMPAQFDWTGWLGNFPRALSNHLPWVLFAPLLWRRDFLALGSREWALFGGTRLAVVVSFFGILLLPGMLPRYTLSLLAPFAVLLAYAVADTRLAPTPRALRIWWRTNTALSCVILLAALASPAIYAFARRKAFTQPGLFPGGFTANIESVMLAAAGAVFLALFILIGRRKLARPVLLASASAGIAGAGILLYAGIGIPLQNARDHLRPAARKIEAAIPSGRGLVIYDPDYQPVIFYLQTPYRYVIRGDDVAGIKFPEFPAPPPPVEPPAPWVLARLENRARLRDDLPGYAIALEISKPLNLALMRPVQEPAAAVTAPPR